MGLLSRRKGASWERDVAKRFAAVFGDVNVRRGLQYRDGAECADVVCPHFWLEAKVGKQTNPRAALRQAIGDSEGKGLVPVAVCKDDGEQPFVAMLLSNFLDLVAEWHALRSAR
jgi:hypothetical protein